jgi:hypothetical protein
LLYKIEITVSFVLKSNVFGKIWLLDIFLGDYSQSANTFIATGCCFDTALKRGSLARLESTESVIFGYSGMRSKNFFRHFGQIFVCFVLEVLTAGPLHSLDFGTS